MTIIDYSKYSHKNCTTHLYTIDNSSVKILVIEWVSRHILEPIGFHRYCMIRSDHYYGVSVHSHDNGKVTDFPMRYAGLKTQQLINKYNEANSIN